MVVSIVAEVVQCEVHLGVMPPTSTPSRRLRSLSAVSTGQPTSILQSPGEQMAFCTQAEQKPGEKSAEGSRA
jgi:hypothetical protein